jgi:hypothetical protein
MTNSDNAQAPEQPPMPAPEIRPMEANERIIQANGVDLCVQTFGDSADSPILLIMGGAASMDWWEEGFCERLAAGSRFVVRYDHRDTGRSVSYEPGAAPYSLRDLAEDAVGLLDAFGLESAHPRPRRVISSHRMHDATNRTLGRTSENTHSTTLMNKRKREDRALLPQAPSA